MTLSHVHDGDALAARARRELGEHVQAVHVHGGDSGAVVAGGVGVCELSQAVVGGACWVAVSWSAVRRCCSIVQACWPPVHRRTGALVTRGRSGSRLDSGGVLTQRE